MEKSYNGVVSLLIVVISAIILNLPNSRCIFKENFLDFANNTINKNLVDSLTSVATSTMISVSQSCQNTAQFDNKLNITCNPSDSVVATYLSMKNQCITNVTKNGGDPSTVCTAENFSPCYVQNIKQDQVVSFKTGCTLDSKAIQDFVNKISDKIDQSTNNSEDALGKAITTVATGIATAGNSGNTTENDVITNIKKELKNTMNISLANQLSTTFIGSNQISIGGNGFVVKDVLQSQAFTIISDAIAKNDVLNKLLTQADTNANQSSTNKLSGLFDSWWIFLIIGVVLLLMVIMSLLFLF